MFLQGFPCFLPRREERSGQGKAANLGSVIANGGRERFRFYNDFAPFKKWPRRIRSGGPSKNTTA